jgi:hypothetical protein
MTDDAELAELRRRAYGPNADIDADPIALARLDELEESIRARFRSSRLSLADPARLSPADLAPPSVAVPAPLTAAPPTDAPPTDAPPTEAPPTDELPTEAPPQVVSPDIAESLAPAATTASSANDSARIRSAPVSAAPPTQHHSRRAPRWHTSLLVATAATAVALSAVAWSNTKAEQQVAANEAIPVVEDQDWAMSSAADFTNYLDGLRDEFLSGEGMESIAGRMIREKMLPYGDLYGHTVWAGSTTDGAYCMIIDEAPAPSIGCISVEDAYASPLTIVLPAVVTDDTDDTDDAALEPGAPISFTLLPGGTVVTEPSDAWNYPLD